MDFIRIFIFVVCMNSSVSAGFWGEICPGGIPDGLHDNTLHLAMEKKLFGQHIVMKIIPKVITKHLSKQNSKKALALSFHGTTGNGKTFVSELIAKYIYKEGVASKFVHTILGHKYRDLRKLHEYQKELEELIVEKTALCERSLFIFSEVDEMPRGMLNVLTPYLDYHNIIDGVNYRKNIFVFLSNVGGEQIREVTLQHLDSGGKRETIPSKKLANILSINSLATGGFEKSHLLLSGLVDFFLPFLPLEEFHVKQCILEELSSRDNFKCSGKLLEITDKVAQEIQYYPRGKHVFALNGCKMIDKKVDIQL